MLNSLDLAVQRINPVQKMELKQRQSTLEWEKNESRNHANDNAFKPLLDEAVAFLKKNGKAKESEWTKELEELYGFDKYENNIKKENCFDF